MKHSMKLMFVFAMLSITAALPLSPNAADIDPEANSILERAVKSIAGADSASVSVESVVNLDMNGMKDGYSYETELAWKKPNRFTWTPKGESTAPSVVSNGESLIYYFPETEAYVKELAPASLNEFDLFPGNEDYVQGVRNPEWVYLDFMLGADPWQTLTEDVVSVKFIEPEAAGDPLHVIQLERSDFTYTFFITEGDTPQIKSIEPEWNEFIAEGNPGKTSKLKIENQLVFTEWKLGEPVSDERFAFTPPENARKAESLEDAMVPPAPSAPDFSVELLDGGTFSLKEEIGEKIIVLDFWATWCPPCRQAMPILEEIGEKYEEDVKILALNQQESTEKIRGYLDQTGLSPTVALDDGSIASLYQVTGYPTFVIIDKAGKIQDVIPGFDPQMEKRIQRLIDSE